MVEYYLWQDKTTLLATYDGDGNLKQRFEYTVGHTPSRFSQDGETYYILASHLGSPRAIVDSSGEVLREIQYDSYGNVIEDSNPEFSIPFGFAGGLTDEYTGLIRFGYRDYDPRTGRWTARDPIGFAGGDLNLYGYVLRDPINYFNPKGLSTVGVHLNGNLGLGKGITVRSGFVRDSDGNIAFQIGGGAGGTPPQASMSLSTEYTNAVEVTELGGIGAQSGANARLPAGPGVASGLVVGGGEEGRYEGVYSEASLGFGTPGVSTYATRTYNVFVFNPRETWERVKRLMRRGSTCD
uniref:RHS repeat-associated core domain-containing protein n=1 Tax=Natronospira proteinivora TaxID=1807133 RepID=UPI00344BD590